MLTSRFFRRLFLPYLLLICAATAAVGAFAALRLRSAYLDRTRQALGDEAKLVSDLVGADAGAGRETRVAAKARELGARLNCRITIITDAGKVLGDNEANPQEMENHRQRPEVVEAASSGQGDSIRHSATIHADLLYLARKAQTPDGTPYFVRLAVHLAALDRELNLLYGGLTAVTLAAMAIAASIGFYFARRNTAPVRELAGFAQALARGEMGRRLMLAGGGEIATLTTSLNAMADSLSSLLSQLGKERAELLAIVASMSDGVIAIDTRQRIVLVNNKAAELLDFDPQGAQGKALWEVVRNEPVLRAAGEVLAGSERRAFQVSPMAGRYLEVAACAFPTAGAMEGLVLVAHDTTKSVRYQELRKEFVANVSHELRTPLTVIKGFTETLRDGAMKDPVAGPRFLATIARHVDQLTNLVNDLLELSRLESSPEMPRRVNFDLGALVRRVTDLLQPAAQKKGQNVTLDINGPLPRAWGNPDYLERAISNLIDNAIKYTPENGKVNVSVARNHGDLVVEVADNGIGIPAPDLDRIFERFYRVDRSRSRDMGGTGLGLSIVKHVAQVHGGSVDVESSPGTGSRFRLNIPAPPEE
ncbi:MAG TPA: ATP-binding protein [Tepidisphaeraceae bacterium]|nr:ATP-binding protein [Tepidisphaeraceae bacterium]